MDYAWFPSKNPKHITTTNQPQENDDAPFGHNLPKSKVVCSKHHQIQRRLMNIFSSFVSIYRSICLSYNAKTCPVLSDEIKDLPQIVLSSMNISYESKKRIHFNHSSSKLISIHLIRINYNKTSTIKIYYI